MNRNQLNYEFMHLMQQAETARSISEAKDCLAKAEKLKAALAYTTPKDRYSRWCGGPGGFDDYSERLH